MTLITLSTAWLIGIAAAHYANPPPALVGPLAVGFAVIGMRVFLLFRPFSRPPRGSFERRRAQWIDAAHRLGLESAAEAGSAPLEPRAIGGSPAAMAAGCGPSFVF